MREVVRMIASGTVSRGSDAAELDRSRARKKLDKSLLSVVVPIYNEEATLPELLRRLPRALEGLGFRGLEFLLVSDGSRDDSERMIRRIAARDPRFQGIFLTRNFGHQAAVSIGIAHARGTVVAVIDADLQDPPEAIGSLVAGLERGSDVAYGVRKKRKEGIPLRWAYFAFYRVLRFVSMIDVPLDSGDFCCMRRQVVNAMLALPERNRFVRGLRAWVGFEQVGVEIERAPRFAGEPKYTLRKNVALAYDGLFSFTNLPVRFIQVAGFILSFVAIMIALGYFVWYFIAPDRFPQGFASLIISIWLFAGIQMLFLGIVGEYVVRTCDEGRGRPVALVREVVRSSRTRAPESDLDGVSDAEDEEDI
jgi:polyisoprenyl-phosphate glycosyltransferase